MSAQELGQWVEENKALFTLKIDAQTRARISQYEPGSSCAGQWHFIVYRDKADISGIVKTLDDAKAEANRLVDMHLSIFVRQIADRLNAEIKARLADLAEIGCEGDIDGFAYGFRTGYNQALTDLISSAQKMIGDDATSRVAEKEGVAS